jgi:hypothetical protein
MPHLRARPASRALHSSELECGRACHRVIGAVSAAVAQWRAADAATPGSSRLPSAGRSFDLVACTAAAVAETHSCIARLGLPSLETAAWIDNHLHPEGRSSLLCESIIRLNAHRRPNFSGRSDGLIEGTTDGLLTELGCAALRGGIRRICDRARRSIFDRC